MCGAYVFAIVIFSYFMDSFIIMYYLSSSLITVFVLKSFFFYKTVYLFIIIIIIIIIIILAVLGLHCTRAFSSCGEWGLLFVAVHVLLIMVASLVAEHGL